MSHFLKLQKIALNQGRNISRPIEGGKMNEMNKKIAEMMELCPAVSPYTHKHMSGLESKLCYYSGEDFCTSMPLAKLLQARMADDGWMIDIEQIKNHFTAHAYKHNDSMMMDTFSSYIQDTEPAALCALFCKVYNIPFDGKE
jgi:hypothetical protein